MLNLEFAQHLLSASIMTHGDLYSQNFERHLMIPTMDINFIRVILHPTLYVICHITQFSRGSQP